MMGRRFWNLFIITYVPIDWSHGALLLLLPPPASSSRPLPPPPPPAPSRLRPPSASCGRIRSALLSLGSGAGIVAFLPMFL